MYGPNLEGFLVCLDLGKTISEEKAWEKRSRLESVFYTRGHHSLPICYCVPSCAVRYTSVSQNIVTCSWRNKAAIFRKKSTKSKEHYLHSHIFSLRIAKCTFVGFSRGGTHVTPPTLLPSCGLKTSTAAGLSCCRTQAQFQIIWAALGLYCFPLFQCSSDCPGFQLLRCTLCVCPDDGLFKSKYCWWSKNKIRDSRMGSASLCIQCNKHLKQ